MVRAVRYNEDGLDQPGVKFISVLLSMLLIFEVQDVTL
jgi:hypothetical protein